MQFDQFRSQNGPHTGRSSRRSRRNNPGQSLLRVRERLVVPRVALSRPEEEVDVPDTLNKRRHRARLRDINALRSEFDIEAPESGATDRIRHSQDDEKVSRTSDALRGMEGGHKLLSKTARSSRPSSRSSRPGSSRVTSMTSASSRSHKSSAGMLSRARRDEQVRQENIEMLRDNMYLRDAMEQVEHLLMVTGEGIEGLGDPATVQRLKGLTCTMWGGGPLVQSFVGRSTLFQTWVRIVHITGNDVLLASILESMGVCVRMHRGNQERLAMWVPVLCDFFINHGRSRAQFASEALYYLLLSHARNQTIALSLDGLRERVVKSRSWKWTRFDTNYGEKLHKLLFADHEGRSWSTRSEETVPGDSKSTRDDRKEATGTGSGGDTNNSGNSTSENKNERGGGTQWEGEGSADHMRAALHGEQEHSPTHRPPPRALTGQQDDDSPNTARTSMPDDSEELMRSRHDDTALWVDPDSVRVPGLTVTAGGGNGLHPRE